MAHPRKILITGVTSGIGQALANRLAENHAVAGVGRKPEPEADAKACQFYIQADLSKPADASETIAASLLSNSWTSLDNVILNAGTGYVVEDGAESTEIIRETLATNMVSPIVLARTLFPWLAKRNGTLTLIGSVARKGQSMFPTYAASKAGLDGFARALRSEWQGRVAVQVIHPGPTKTAMHSKAGFDPGKAGEFFVPADAAAAMIEGQIVRKSSPRVVSFLQHWSAGAARARRLT
ncbi:MAG: SDR family oxidoreductase [Pseudomonadota bacterium]